MPDKNTIEKAKKDKAARNDQVHRPVNLCMMKLKR